MLVWIHGSQDVSLLQQDLLDVQRISSKWLRLPAHTWHLIAGEKARLSRVYDRCIEIEVIEQMGNLQSGKTNIKY